LQNLSYLNVNAHKKSTFRAAFSRTLNRNIRLKHTLLSCNMKFVTTDVQS